MFYLKYYLVLIKIFFAQDITKIVKRIIYKKKRHKNDVVFIEGINHFYSSLKKTKRALVTLPPFAWHEALKQEPNIKNFNFIGLLYEIVKNLNQHGFVVDILDLENDNYTLQYQYDLMVGHGGGIKNVILQISNDVPILQYVSGAYHEGFIEETERRYNRFKERNNISENIGIKRRMLDIIEGESFLTKNANFLFSCFAPRMIETFKEEKNKFFFTGLAAYVDKRLYVKKSKKNFINGRNNFIYVGGTNGNIQKGADLIIEAFAKTPNANLYIYCELEGEIIKYYKKELNLPNIIYIYHYKFFKGILNRLMHKINFTIHAPINTGLGTAFAGSLGVGLIPVGYVDIMKDEEWNILCDNPTVDELVVCIQKAIGKDYVWYKNAAEKTIRFYNEYWTPTNFSNKFNELISLTINERKI